MVRRRMTTRQKFSKVVAQEQSAVRRGDFKKAIKLNLKGAKLVRILEHRRLKRSR